MIREICKDEIFLAQQAEPATSEDLPVAADLLETLKHHQDGCVGMAANMIGVNKRIIAFDNEGSYMVMFNPEIIKKSDPYTAQEGCLSLSGIRMFLRYSRIIFCMFFFPAKCHFVPHSKPPLPTAQNPIYTSIIIGMIIGRRLVLFQTYSPRASLICVLIRPQSVTPRSVS